MTNIPEPPENFPPDDDTLVQSRAVLEVNTPPPEMVRYVTGYDTTDLGNAMRLVAIHGADMHWIPELKKWVVWNGTRWQIDQTGEADRRAENTARSILQEAYAETDTTRAKRLSQWAFASQSHGKLTVMLERAKSQPGVTMALSSFDRDPYALNFYNGTLDLRTGILRPANPLDLITKQVELNYDSGAECPQFLKFLNEIMAGNASMIHFLQRGLGYSLTGDTGEQCLFIPYGRGANGKTVLMETILGILGEDYAINARAETVIGDRHSGATNDLARLKGARFVTINEIPAQGRLDEARIKEMTGSDTITARFLFCEEFSFRPEFKLWVRTNYKPVVQGVDDGIWRRLKLLPFVVTIPQEARDPKLLQKLQTEWQGILSWLVQGCLEWQQTGLDVPEEVRQATKEYKEEMDILSPFFEAKCILEASQSATSAQIYKAYLEYCEDTGERRPLKQNALSRELTARGFDKKRTSAGAVYNGIGLKPRPAQVQD